LNAANNFVSLRSIEKPHQPPHNSSQWPVSAK